MLHFSRAFCVKKQKANICFKDNLKRLSLKLLLSLGFFCVLTNQIRFANIDYLRKKNR